MLLGGVGGHEGSIDGREGEGGGEATLLDISYRVGEHQDLVKWTKVVLEEQRTVRGEDTAAGRMVGAGQHMRRTGFVGPFYTDSEQSKRQLAAAMEVGGARLGEHFAGRGVGWEEMLEVQGEMWPGGGNWPRCWDASDGLGNALHCDPDGWRSYAAWVSNVGHGGLSSGWWFLFPRHGVAIELVHGTFISWDGRVQPHCTSVPRVGDGDRLLSLFCSLPADVMRAHDRHAKCMPVLRERMKAGREGLTGRDLFESLALGDAVVYRVAQDLPRGFKGGKREAIKWGRAHVRWARAKVHRIAHDHLWVRDATTGKEHYLSVSDVHNRLMRANSLK